MVPVANGQIAEAERAGALVICTQDWHPDRHRISRRTADWPVHCVTTRGERCSIPIFRVVRRGSQGHWRGGWIQRVQRPRPAERRHGTDDPPEPARRARRRADRDLRSGHRLLCRRRSRMPVTSAIRWPSSAAGSAPWIGRRLGEPPLEMMLRPAPSSSEEPPLRDRRQLWHCGQKYASAPGDLHASGSACGTGGTATRRGRRPSARRNSPGLPNRST